MNEFSIVCRILGSLFYRAPQDALLAPLFTALQQGALQKNWPLAQDALLEQLQKNYRPAELEQDYKALFIGAECGVSPWRSDYDKDYQEADVRTFLQLRGMPLPATPADHFGGLLLAASWLEDQAQPDETAAQIALFDDFILPWSDRFLGQVESHAKSAFYRTLAALSREALEAMREDLAESESGAE
ncbi:molecular chaperone [Affinibrenneria salicis]|uniref:Molecular chaperone n=1 Tax=Affinibrenneria salicis TaxID=2590031 RepID=A0A5J5G3S2_9GAMM|nr:molecular chaperone [Affinibrenneria salicis]KAA9001660.1 molecular chaperone [Affinibrenneria salicis]